MKMMEIARGHITSTVYNFILEDRFEEVIEVLEQLVEKNPRSRAGLSLLGYCYFNTQSFQSAARMYEELCNIYPNNNDYAFNMAHCLYNATMYEEANKALSSIKHREFVTPTLFDQIMKLEAAIHYCTDEIADSRIALDKVKESSDPEVIMDRGCLDYKEGKYKSALENFLKSSEHIGFNPQLWYNLALTHFQMKNMSKAIHYLGEIIEHCAIQYPDLCIGIDYDGNDKSSTSVGNSKALHESVVVEAMNLKSALEYQIGKQECAQATMRDLPPRKEQELDPITLHNLAILNIDEKPAEAFSRLNYLLSQATFPSETFTNLLSLYSKYEQYDMIADLLTLYEECKYKYLSPFIRKFFSAMMLTNSAPSEACSMMDELSNQVADEMRQLVKKLADERAAGNDALVEEICENFDVCLQQSYLPTVMSHAKILWDKDDYKGVEAVLKKAVEFCEENDIWKLNVAHVLYMQGCKHQETIRFYESVVKKYFNKVFDINAISMANLCVSYVLSNENEKAENIMKKIELQESEYLRNNAGSKVFHLCIVNMVIGTLYCSRKNFDFGISRMLTSMEPLEVRLGPDTWHYFKCCFLKMIERIMRHSIRIRSIVLDDCFSFLKKCEVHGRNIRTVIGDTDDKLKSLRNDNGKKLSVQSAIHTVTYEARYLRYLLILALDMELDPEPSMLTLKLNI